MKEFMFKVKVLDERLEHINVSEVMVYTCKADNIKAAGRNLRTWFAFKEQGALEIIDHKEIPDFSCYEDCCEWWQKNA